MQKKQKYIITIIIELCILVIITISGSVALKKQEQNNSIPTDVLISETIDSALYH